MEKILLSSHEDEAKAFIDELSGKYLPACRTAIIGISKLGLGVPSKSVLFDIIDGNFESLRSAYDQMIQSDTKNFKSPIVQAQMGTAARNEFEEFRNTIPGIFSKKIASSPIRKKYSSERIERSLNDKFFQQFIDCDASGVVFIPTQTLEKIGEFFKEYLIDARAVKIYQAHQEAGKAIQSFIDALREAENTELNTVLLYLPGAPWQFLASSFTVEVKKDEEGVEITEFKVIPRQSFNYNL
jgi:hypothetical protein